MQCHENERALRYLTVILTYFDSRKSSQQHRSRGNVDIANAHTIEWPTAGLEPLKKRCDDTTSTNESDITSDHCFAQVCSMWLRII
jgi:hypothetical protein